MKHSFLPLCREIYEGSSFFYLFFTIDGDLTDGVRLNEEHVIGFY